MQNISKRLTVAIIVLIIAIVAGGWFWYASVQEKQVQMEVTLQQQKDDLKSQEAGLISQIPEDGEMHPRSPHIVSIEGKDTVWYEIPELGVKAELNYEFAHNLMYAVQSYHTVSSGMQGVTAYFLSGNSVREGCALNELSYGEDGALSILYTKNINELQSDDFFPSADPRRDEASGRQLENFYIYSGGHTETCVPFDESNKRADNVSNNLYKGSGAIFIDVANVVPINAQ